MRGAVLSTKLNDELIGMAAGAGLSTIEFGVETFVPNVQRLIQKRQPFDLFERNLASATRAGVHVVVNYITGFPGENPDESRAWLERTTRVVERHAPLTKYSLNTFELERRAPLTKLGEAVGIRATRSWPWCSIVEWEAVTPRGREARRLPIVEVAP